MVVTLLSWGWIFVSSFLIGYCLLKVFLRLSKNDLHSQNEMSLDMVLLFGLVTLTVYSQFFSLFAKVGLLSNLIVVVFLLLILVVYRQPLSAYINKVKTQKPNLAIIIITIFIILICVYLASGPVILYDTDLYHAQAIRWLEEYGIAPGLGNIHTRLAYDSSFFSLQAFYSLRYIMPYSLHSLNGFYVAFFLIYSVTTMGIFHDKKIKTSDLFKLGLIFYYCFGEVKTQVSAPGSDVLTLSLVLFLAMKWYELNERESDGEKAADFIFDYSLLAVLAVFAFTVKLSSGLMVLLVVYPAFLLIKEKKWREIMLFVVAGFFILLPFLARNVILSGYLLYPYPALDLFSFDWKMPADLAAYDKLEIMAYGRAMTNHADYSAPFNIWFPVWYSELTIRYRFLVWLNPICLLLCIGYLIILIKKARFSQVTFFVVSISSLLLWFFTSPLIRYGMVYLLLLPILVTGVILEKLNRTKWDKRINYIALCVVLIYCGLSMIRHIGVQGRTPLFHPNDYVVRECRQIEWEGIMLFLPIHDDRVCYHHFPGMQPEFRLATIELRSDNIKDGFRVKKH